MNDNEIEQQAGSLVPAAGPGTLVPRSGDDEFENPGLPPHIHRAGDEDPKAAKRYEHQVAALFGLSMLSTLVFLVSYFAIADEATVFIPGIGQTKTQNVVLGLSLGFALFFIGIGAVHWAKTLMSDEEIVEERHLQASSPEARADAVTRRHGRRGSDPGGSPSGHQVHAWWGTRPLCAAARPAARRLPRPAARG